MSSPGATSTALPPASLPGLINTAPGLTSTNTGVTPAGATPGTPVTGYTPANATATNAAAATYNPNAFNVTPQMTAAGQIKDIIASGSPLMDQAVASAKNAMNARGLINSSQAITAGQNALYTAALPIAQQDANTYAAAGTNTTTAQNAALASGAAAQNTAALQNSQLQTGTSQYNVGQTNAALAASANASNTASITAQQIAGTKSVADLQALTQQAIAQIQSNTSLSVEEKQTQSAQIVAAMNNQSAQLVQQMANESSLANIQANGVINTAITNLTNQNKTLLQTSSGAAQVYSQALQNLSAIMTNNNLTADQKQTALNNGVQQLNDALSALTTIAGIPDIQSLLTFGPGQTTAQPNAPGTPDNGAGLINGTNVP